MYKNLMTAHWNIVRCLEEYANIGKKEQECGILTQEECDALDYFELNLAKALMQDFPWEAEKVAKIILAAKGLSDITVKVK